MQDELRSADLQVRRDLTHIRIAEDNMQPPKARFGQHAAHRACVQQGTSRHGVNAEQSFQKSAAGDLDNLCVSLRNFPGRP